MDWPTIAHTTIAHYIREVEENILRERKLLALMRSKGRIAYNEFGTNLNWKVRYKRAPLNTFLDGETITFARRDRWKTAELEWRAYNTTDMASKFDQLKNSGAAQIIDLFATKAEQMLEEIEEHFGDELYANGATDGRRLHGIETFCTQGSAIASTPVYAPSATYAGLSCVLGAYGGQWSGTTWPLGKGEAHYDFWSPLLIDYGSSYWGGSGQTFLKNGFSAIRFGLLKARRAKAKKGMPDLVLLENEMYRAFLDAADDKEQIQVNRGQESTMVKLGFGDTMNLDGCDITSEFGVPDLTGYIFNTQQMMLSSMQGKLFDFNGPIPNEETQSFRFITDFYGNLRFNPRGFAKLYQFSGP